MNFWVLKEGGIGFVKIKKSVKLTDPYRLSPNYSEKSAKITKNRKLRKRGGKLL